MKFEQKNSIVCGYYWFVNRFMIELQPKVDNFDINTLHKTAELPKEKVAKRLPSAYIRMKHTSV